MALSWTAAQGAAPATADAYPNHPIRIVVPFPPGASPNDITARLLGPKLADEMRQQVVVDNRPGAAGTIGTDLVSKSTPDGHALLINSTTLTIAPNAYPSLPFDPAKDLAPITVVAAAPQLVMGHASVPVSSLKELIAYVKARPAGQFKFSSDGNGTVTHLAGELLNHLAGQELERAVSAFEDAGLLRTDEEVMRDIFEMLPFQRMGPRIRDRLESVVSALRTSQARGTSA